jgi:hypothetical protein
MGDNMNEITKNLLAALIKTDGAEAVIDALRELTPKPTPEDTTSPAHRQDHVELRDDIRSAESRLTALEDAVTKPSGDAARMILAHEAEKVAAHEGRLTPGQKAIAQIPRKHNKIKKSVLKSWKRTTLAHRIYNFLRDNGMNAKDLGVAMGVSQSTASRYMGDIIKKPQHLSAWLIDNGICPKNSCARLISAHNHAEKNI